MVKTINTAVENVPLSLLKPHPRNANHGDFGAIQESIGANGFYGTIVANKRTGHILAGNHRYAVAKSSAMETIPVSWVDVSQEEEIRILVADNRTTRLGQDDNAVLSEILAELAATDKGLIGTGFDGDDLDRLISDLTRGEGTGIDPNAEWEGMPEFDNEDRRAFRTIKVHFANTDDVDDFARLIGQKITEKALYTWHPKVGNEDTSSLKYDDEQQT